jgi:hypothetical protein
MALTDSVAPAMPSMGCESLPEAASSLALSN